MFFSVDTDTDLLMRGSGVAGLTQDPGVAGSSLPRGSAIVSLSKTVYILLKTDSTLKDLS